ncbi:hypothetical protein ADS73_13860 [Lactiplantibacillus plantarum]|nr:hypothetical protein ADS73_13860 [Lactiplantibacillus plantarum]
MIKFRAWYMPFGKYGAMQEMVYSRASHILALAETEPEKYIPEQFTGLKDVNGKDIYEGDIARYTRWADHVGIVRYFKPEFELQNIGLDIDIAPTLTMRHELRVIGNAHENPELLEAGK